MTNTMHNASEPIANRLKFLSIALLVAALYVRVVASWMQDWWNDESYSHGFLAAGIAVWIAWRQRDQTLAVPAAPSSKGLGLTALALAVYLIGQLGSEFFITRLSLVILIVGITWTFWGLPRLRRIAFPLLLLASVVPPPVILYNKISAPLQLLASKIATQVAQSLGASVFREGNVIQFANISLGVAEACSGLRSLASLTVGALLLGYAERMPVTSRVVVFFLAVPIAILFNVLRVTGTALLAEQNPELAMGYYHLVSGWLVFVAGFGALFLCTKVLKAVYNPKRAGVAQ